MQVISILHAFSRTIIIMAKKKSQAQIHRMIKRAEARGETYQPPPPQGKESSKKADPIIETDNNETTSTTPPQLNPAEQAKLQAARTLTKELYDIERNENFKAKERRSAKRKAEAIAAESAGCPAPELIEWYAAYQKTHAAPPTDSKKRKIPKNSVAAAADDDNDAEQHYKNPYIAFVGQLSFDTTKEELSEHIKQALGQEFQVSNETVQIRLLTNEKTGKSRGMAFVQVDNPEFLYALLRLHQTFLHGRRINVERSAGGRANSQTKRQKLQQYRKEQDEYMSSVVEKMLQEFYQNGSIQPDELDAAVIALFHRHSANIVQAALERYVETNGRLKDNPSAYLNCLVGKMTSEGIFSNDEEKKTGNRSFSNKRSTASKSIGSHKDTSSSLLKNEGINMRAAEEASSNNIGKIFPSYNRGRGRR